MIDILSGEGAEWTPLEITDEYRAELLSEFTCEELAELNIYGSSMRANAMRAEENDRVKRSCLMSLRDSLTHAELDGDEFTASRLRMTIAAAEMLEVAADIVDIIRLTSPSNECD
ncbi:hypothetical protein [Sphingomonas sp. IC081]|uniref:hypothetical protein n=1 Tax=Sphingomonas sp. IC081 TaxID=304378 RepID=UPI00115A4400|nr:hypothetical protein [Sphingomonas sp. IC081]QDK32658.1 hypothetical protein DM450_07645 [Sphingomonas sp. IC081]